MIIINITWSKVVVLTVVLLQGIVRRRLRSQRVGKFPQFEGVIPTIAGGVFPIAARESAFGKYFTHLTLDRFERT
jgi:hypothetical protein